MVEVRPPVEWHKGHAVLFVLVRRHGADWLSRVRALYIGDDVTDEDAFRSLRGIGRSVYVSPHPASGVTADFRLPDPDAVLQLLREATGHAPEEVHVVGGGSQNELLCQWTADATGIPALAGPAEATEVGNLVVQAIALGELSSVQEGRELVEASFPVKAYEPRESAAWTDARERFAGLVAQPEGIGA